jgi:hypothetical protein
MALRKRKSLTPKEVKERKELNKISRLPQTTLWVATFVTQLYNLYCAFKRD